MTTKPQSWSYFDLATAGPIIHEALMRASTSLALKTSCTCRAAINQCDITLAELLATGPNTFFPRELSADLTSSMQIALASLNIVSPSNEAFLVDKGLCDVWLDLMYVLLAEADLEVNYNGTSFDAWLERTKRRFGRLALAGDIASAVYARPSGGAAIWAVRRLRHEERLPETWDLDWLAKEGAYALLCRDSLSQDHRTDIPASLPLMDVIPVEAGVTDVDLRCIVRGLSGEAHETVHATASLMASTYGRGVHMSRFQEAVHDLMDVPHDSMLAIAQALVAEISRRHPAIEIRVQIHGKRIVPMVAAITRRRSSVVALESIEVHDRSGERHVTQEFSVGFMNACPCTLKYSELLAERALDQSFGANRPAVNLPPTSTHSQPGTLRLRVSGSEGSIPDADEVWRSLLAVAHLRQAVLKRADEHALVEQVHRRPQFSEDIVRDAAIDLASRCRDGNVVIEAIALVDESIHNHRAIAKVRACAMDLWATP